MTYIYFYDMTPRFLPATAFLGALAAPLEGAAGAGPLLPLM
jgi:hypothetical protein